MRRTTLISIASLVLVSAFGTSGSAQAAEDCTLKLISEIDLLSEDAAVFEGSFGAKPYKMALDARSSYSYMSRPVAEENQITLKEFGRQGGYIVEATVRGQKIYQYAQAPSLIIGGLNMKEFHLTAVPKWEDSVSAYFGGDFFTQFDIELDLSHKKMSFFLKDHCPGQVVYWTDQYTSFPFRFGTFNNIFFKTELDGETVEAAFDTTSSKSTIARRLAETKFNVEENDPNSDDAPDGAFKRLVLGGVAIGSPQFELRDIPACKETQVSKADMAGPSYRAQQDCGYAMMNVGTNVMKKLRIYFAAKEKKIYMSAANATK